MISFVCQSCCGERASSHINAVKTKGRTLLGDDTFNDCIWLTYNLPPLHLVNYDRFVKAWKKDGTQRMGIFKGAEAAGPDDPNSASPSGAPPPLCHIAGPEPLQRRRAPQERGTRRSYRQTPLCSTNVW